MRSWNEKWFQRRLLFVIGFNLALFLTPSFWSCTTPPKEETKTEKTKDASVERVQEKSKETTPKDTEPTTDADGGDAGVPENKEPTAEKKPEVSGPDWHQANTPWKSNDKQPDDGETFEIRMPSVSVAAGSERLHCVVGVMKTKFVRMLHRFEPLLDQKSLVKRIWVSQDDGKKTGDWDCSSTGPIDADTKPFYIWEPGMKSFQFPEKSGIRVEAATRIRIAILYKNDGKTDATDDSGMKFTHIVSTGNKWRLFSRFVDDKDIKLDPGVVKEGSISCPVKTQFSMLAASPYLHTHGRSFISEILRKDGSRDELLFLTAWDHTKHLKMYQAPFTLREGDKLLTSCNWHNKTSGLVSGGWKTNDAGCGLLLYVTADSGDELCGKEDDGSGNVKVPPLKYKKGRCAAKTALTKVGIVKVSSKVGQLPTKIGLKGGKIPPGNWELTKVDAIFKPGLITSFLKQGYSQAAGQINSTSTKLHLDVVVQVLAEFGGRDLPYKLPLSVAGALQKASTPDQYTIKFSCGKIDNATFTYEVTDKTLRLQVKQKITASVGTLELFLDFSFTKK